MSTLNRYIATLYLMNTAILLLILCSLVVCVDVVVNLGRYSGNAAQRLAESGSAGAGWLHHALLSAVLVIDLWGPRLSQLLGYLIGVVLVAAMGFTCAQLSRNREFTAMLASGISLYRLARPFLLVGLLAVLVQAANQQFIVPAVAHLLWRDPGSAGAWETQRFAVRLAPDEQGRVFYAARFDDRAGILESPRIWTLDERGMVQESLAADRARWVDAPGSGSPGQWVFENRAPGPGAQAPDDVRIGPGTAPGWVEAGRIATPLDPDKLKVRYLQGFGESLSWGQVTRMIERGGLSDADRARLDRIRWGHLASLVNNLAVLAAALPFFLMREPRSVLAASLKCAPIAAAGLLMTLVATSVAIPGLPASMAAFVPSVVMGLLGLALFSGVRS